ncbi:class I SAM-dependent methyltransferase [Rhodococcus sp. SGAir0479]|uniref:class I SAM-dependent methyltransferase n=1 Tax=Rhodococcus sp. SGAir0479 TaxID=2567884 RepID=UPI0010CD29D2|nr:class I SAM-dependent methyltransferase [Rhodococcus sp. SGAir0479]QCQ93307.1 class I SAM-dependent methyltransferase [Rhodococcus sp. SGAir0479]
MSESLVSKEADRTLKAKHRAVWASGNYPAVAEEIIPELGPILVRAADVQSGQRVLDVGAGSGNAAIPAALAGADVVASDLTPELFDAGRRLAAKRGAQLDWEVADAEAMPFEDDRFDVVLSCVGVMFAPHHQDSADELVRVCKPGGTIGLLSWTPDGFIGRMFAAMKPYAPPPPPGAQPPPLWGDETHVRELLGDRVTDVRSQRDVLRVDRFDGPEDFVDYFKANYGPTIAVYKAVADDADRVTALDRDLTDLARRFDVGDGSFVMDWEYLLLTAHERP